MGKRRRPALQYTSSSDDDDDGDHNAAAPEAPSPAAPGSPRRHSAADTELAEDGNVPEETSLNPGRPAAEGEEEEGSDGEPGEKAESDEEDEDDDEDGAEAVPLGEPVELPGEGRQYAAYEYEGITYNLEDTAMFSPGEKDEKPYVGIIKEINEINGRLLVTAQWFYRPEEAQKEGGGVGDPRELLYSFHLDEVVAESVMHTCVVHFIPQHKQVPNKKEHPGFIVQQVYDHKEDKYHKLTDTDYDDANQKEIDLLVAKTMNRIGELLDRDPQDIPGDKSDYLPGGGLKKKPLKPKDVPRDAPAGRSKQFIKDDTAGNNDLKNRAILSRYKVLTGNQSRDKWLDIYVDTILALPHSPNDNKNSYAPDLVVSIVASIERSTFEALHPDFRKYNHKMRTLLFNIKNSSVLCKRLMNRELDPPVLLTMAPNELKAGLAPAEIGFEFEEPRQFQMTEARCKRCKEKNVGIREIMHGNRGDRYQVQCDSCGFEWSASRDEVFFV